MQLERENANTWVVNWKNRATSTHSIWADVMSSEFEIFGTGVTEEM